MDDLLPGERATLHLTLARALEQRADDDAGAVLTAAIAHHFAAAGEQPAALEWSVRAATAAERVYAHGEARALLEHALELWDRVPDAEERAGEDRISLLCACRARRVGARASGAPARAVRGGARRARPRDRPAPGLEDAGGHRSRAAQPQPPEVEHRDARARARARRGRRRQGRRSARPPARRPRARPHARRPLRRQREDRPHARSTPPSRPACAGPRATRATRSASRLAMIGEVDEGAEQLREAIRIACERDDLPDLGDAYVNYSDMLHILGRSDEAPGDRARGPRGHRRPAPDRDHVARLPARRVRLRRRRLGGVRAAPARPEALDGRAHAREPQPAQGAPAGRARAPRGGARGPDRARRAGRRLERAAVRRPRRRADRRAAPPRGRPRRAPARRSTAGSTRWSSAPTTPRGCRPSPPRG